MNVELELKSNNIVGESPVWDDRAGSLVWVDIIKQQIHRLNPKTGDHKTWQAPGRVTSIGLRDDGGAILGLERHIAIWDWHETFTNQIEVEPSRPQNRLNEGVVGPDGAFWVGTMFNNIGEDDRPVEATQASGYLYRYSSETGLKKVSNDSFGITNTLVWPSENELITADTTKNEIYSYEVNHEQLIKRKTIIKDFDRGLPDGSCLDEKGYIWNARVAGGGCILRFSPMGEIDRIINLPCSWPTSCAFGGDNLDRLFITSARFTMTDAHLAKNPLEGALFSVDVGVKGLPASRFSSKKTN